MSGILYLLRHLGKGKKDPYSLISTVLSIISDTVLNYIIHLVPSIKYMKTYNFGFGGTELAFDVDTILTYQSLSSV